jgi:AcrR family transcriptional regulator
VSNAAADRFGRAPAPAAGRAAATRERILEAAGRCFAERGFRRARLADVALAAGVSRALVHVYFASKRNLLREVRDRALAGWRAAVEPELERAASAGDALAAMVRHTLRYARTRPFLQAILADDGRAVILGSDATGLAAIDVWRARVLELLRRGVASGEFAADLDVESSADALRAMLLGVIDRMHRPAAPIDVSREAHVEAAVRLILRGVAA